jgi:RNA polymerase sigma-70 factor (ECF subfamily)
MLSLEFRALFERDFAYVCRSLRRLGVGDSDLKDVAQELFVAVHERLASYDPARPLRPWLFSFAVRFASNYRKLARNHAHDSLEGASLGSEGSPQLEARDLILRALARLDFDRRTVIVMHDLEGFDAPEIAGQLGIPVNTVYSRIRLARADLREAITVLQHNGGSR